MTLKTIETQHAPQAIGPYSQAVQAGPFLFCSGQIGMDPATSELAAGGTAEQAERALLNLTAVLNAADLSADDVVKTTVFLTDLADFAGMNDVYARFFGSALPARSTVGVAALPKGATFEIEAVALRA